MQLRPDLIGIHQTFVWHFLLLEDDGSAIAIDTGFGPSGWQMRRWMRRAGRDRSQLRAILLTHAHFDHAGCAASMRAWSKAPIHMHPADIAIVRGKAPHQGIAKAGRLLERMLRPAFRYRTFDIDVDLTDGDELPFWGGLRVVHLPGHTPGHVGFYSASKKILFAGDAVLSRGKRCFFPARAFNVDHAAVRESVVRAAELDAEWVYPSHHRRLEHNLMDDIRQFAQKRRIQGSESDNSAETAAALRR